VCRAVQQLRADAKVADLCNLQQQRQRQGDNQGFSGLYELSGVPVQAHKI
jgi:hypothetical protein